MRYYIVLDDGTTYGPARGATLVAMQDDSILNDLPAADGRDVIAHGDTLTEVADLIVSAGLDPDVEPVGEWSGSPDPNDPDNYWIDDVTGERVNAHTGEREAAQS